MTALVGRYLRREIALTTGGVVVLLVLVTLGGLLTDVLNKVARGLFPPELLLSQIALRIPYALTILLPLAGFLAVLATLTRLYRDNELAVLRTSGLGELDLIRPILSYAIPLMVVLAALSLFIAPLARKIAQEQIDRANQTVAVAGLEPGRFIELRASKTVVYTGRYDKAARRMAEVFVWRQDEDGKTILVRAQEGRVSWSEGSSRLVLDRGQRIDLLPDQSGILRARFERAEVVLPENLNRRESPSLEAVPTLELWQRPGLDARAELELRLGLPLQAVVLLLLAIPLARSAPRRARYDRIVIAILLYVLYTNLLAIAQGWLALGQTPTWLGTAWVHFGFLAVLAWAWWPALRDELRARRAGIVRGLRP